MEPVHLKVAGPRNQDAGSEARVRLLSGARALLGYCDQVGFDAERIVREAGVAAELHDNPDAHLTRPSRLALWRAALSVSGDPDLHLHVAERAPFGAFRVADFVCATAPTLAVALFKLTQLLSTFDVATTCDLVDHGDRSSLVLRCREGATDLSRYEIEYVLAVCCLRARLATKLDFTPLGLEVAAPPPPDAREVERVFGCSVRYGCLTTRLWLRQSDLQRQNARAEPELLDILETRFAQPRTVQAPADPILAAVERVVTEMMGARAPRVDPTARRLGMSARTLQRRLRASGTSFSDLVEQARQRHAQRLLQRSDRALTDIALELGFSEQSAFNRAFKRWTGGTPTQFRSAALRSGLHRSQLAAHLVGGAEREWPTG